MEIQARITSVAPEAFFAAMVKAAPSLSHETICILMAQSALETGRWKKVINNNVGNIKSVPGRDYCFVATTERMTSTSAHQMADASALVRILKDDGKMATALFYPPHSMCRFRSFPDLDTGIVEYLALLEHRYEKAWQSVLSGNPSQFASNLHSLGYYTADPAEYTKAVVSLFNEFSRANFPLAAAENENVRKA